MIIFQLYHSHGDGELSESPKQLLVGEATSGQEAGQQRRRYEAVMVVISGRGGRHHAALIHLGLGQPLGLGAPVLEPDLDLGLAQLQLIRKLRPLRDGEVGLLPVLPLQSTQLGRRERRPRLPVRPMLPQGAFKRGQRQLSMWGGSVATAAAAQLLNQLILKEGRHERGHHQARRHGGTVVGRRRR